MSRLEDERANVAPPNSLPDWSECAMRVENSGFIAKRVAEGGYGPDADSKLASELHRFIYEYDDADSYRSAWFLHRLEMLLNETRRAALSGADAGVSEGWQDIATAPKDEHILIATAGGWVFEARQDLNMVDGEQIWQWVTPDGRPLHKNLVPFAWLSKPAFPQARYVHSTEGAM